MVRRHKPKNIVSISKTRTEMIWTLQGPDTVLKCRLQIGDTTAMEDTQCVSCKPSNTIQGNGTTRAKLHPTTT
jgi:hypothetical protein